MGIFFTSPQPVVPAIQAALHDALITDPKTLAAPPEVEAAARAAQVAQATSPQFNSWRFAGAMVIAAALLATALWADKEHGEIARTLMTSFTSYMGIVLGLFGGEAQKPASGQ